MWVCGWEDSFAFRLPHETSSVLTQVPWKPAQQEKEWVGWFEEETEAAQKLEGMLTWSEKHFCTNKTCWLFSMLHLIETLCSMLMLKLRSWQGVSYPVTHHDQGRLAIFPVVGGGNFHHICIVSFCHWNRLYHQDAVQGVYSMQFPLTFWNIL